MSWRGPTEIGGVPLTGSAASDAALVPFKELDAIQIGSTGLTFPPPIASISRYERFHSCVVDLVSSMVWQLVFLPSAGMYSAATPTECLPFFGCPVSPITRTASLPPTSLSAWTSGSVSAGLHPTRRRRRNEAVGYNPRGEPFRHRLNALVLAGADQTRHIKRQHPPWRLVSHGLQERCQPEPHTTAPVLTGPRRQPQIPCDSPDCQSEVWINIKRTNYRHRKSRHRSWRGAQYRRNAR